MQSKSVDLTISVWNGEWWPASIKIVPLERHRFAWFQRKLLTCSQVQQFIGGDVCNMPEITTFHNCINSTHCIYQSVASLSPIPQDEPEQQVHEMSNSLVAAEAADEWASTACEGFWASTSAEQDYTQVACAGSARNLINIKDCLRSETLRPRHGAHYGTKLIWMLRLETSGVIIASPES